MSDGLAAAERRSTDAGEGEERVKEDGSLDPTAKVGMGDVGEEGELSASRAALRFATLASNSASDGMATGVGEAREDIIRFLFALTVAAVGDGVALVIDGAKFMMVEFDPDGDSAGVKVGEG